jgi:hypothetical protein
MRNRKLIAQHDRLAEVVVVRQRAGRILTNLRLPASAELGVSQRVIMTSCQSNNLRLKNGFGEA